MIWRSPPDPHSSTNTALGIGSAKGEAQDARASKASPTGSA